MKVLTIEEILLSAGFDPESGKVVFQWEVEFKKQDHKPGCQNLDEKDWCSCKHKVLYIKRLVPWGHKLFEKEAAWLTRDGSSDSIDSPLIPKERHRSITLNVIAEDNTAVYYFNQYDGEVWMERIYKQAKDILAMPDDFIKCFHIMVNTEG